MTIRIELERGAYSRKGERCCEVWTIESDNFRLDGPATVTIRRNGCPGHDYTGEWARTEQLTTAESAILKLLDRLRDDVIGWPRHYPWPHTLPRLRAEAEYDHRPPGA